MIEIRPLDAAFGAEVVGLEPTMPLDDEARSILRDAFDERGLLVFRDREIDHLTQLFLTLMLVGREDEVDLTGDLGLYRDHWYISNEREASAAPFGRLQFHVDGMWSESPYEVLSLYGKEVAQPSVPTLFVSAVDAWRDLPDELRSRVEHLDAVHTSGEVRRGNVTDVLVSNVERPSSTTKPLAFTHPRTGVTLLGACEQMTAGIADVDADVGEALLEELFDHMYAPDALLEHRWRLHDLVVWDNISLQHARPNVTMEGPPRTLRKAGYPLPDLAPDEIPRYSEAR